MFTILSRMHFFSNNIVAYNNYYVETAYSTQPADIDWAGVWIHEILMILFTL